VRDDGTTSRAQVSREVPGAMAWSLVAKVLVSLLAIGSNVLIVRGLGEYAYGVYSIYLNIARFFSLGIGLGLAQAVLRFLPELRVRQDGRGTRQLLLRSLWLQLIGWAVVIVAAYLLRGWLSDLQHADLSTILPLGAVLLVFENLWTLLTSVYTALRRMRWLTIASVAQKAALVALLLWLVRDGAEVRGVIYVVAGSFCFGILLLAPRLRALMPWIRDAEGEGMPLKRTAGYALPIALGALINQVLWRSSETLVIGYFHDPAQVGFYNAAYNLGQMILEFVPLAIWPVVLATLSETDTHGGDGLRRGIRLYFRLLFVLVVPVSLTGFVFGGQAYDVLYGAPMAAGMPVCQAFFLVFMLGFFATPLRMALYVRERTIANLLIAAGGAALNVTLDLLLIPPLGIWGGVWAVAAALAASAIAQYVVSRRYVRGLAVPWSDLARVLAASAVVLPFWFVRTALRGPIAVGGAIALALLAQFLMMRALRVFGPEERALLLGSHLPFKRGIVWLLGASGEPPEPPGAAPRGRDDGGG